MKTRKRLEAGLGELAALDPRMGELWERAGTPGPRARPPGFTTLLRVIVGQQLSTHAAAAIWKRMEVAGITKDPAAFIVQDDEDLRAHGLSRQKVVYGRGLAEAVVSGGLKLDALRKQDDETAIAALVEKQTWRLAPIGVQCQLQGSFRRDPVGRGMCRTPVTSLMRVLAPVTHAVQMPVCGTHTLAQGIQLQVERR